ncbi:hypothetical protein HA402_014088 [Bradysia odoriphaga]|nr:hypothetical protein HA402_014088 [Bradysia odoriphaga]
MMKVNLLLFLSCSVVYLKLSSACDGFKFKFNSIENCGGKGQIVTVDSNFTSSINKKCEVTTSGCVSSKGFKEAKAKYTVYKNGMAIMTGTPDLCSEIEIHKEAKIPLEMVGFPTACPIEKGRKCVDGTKKFDVAKFKKYLTMARGKIAVDTEITHDTGTSCFKVEFEIFK